MSVFRAGTISNVAGTGSPDITGGELSRARYNLNGQGVIAARDSFNCSSFTDNGTGDYTATFAIAFPSSGYAMSANSSGTYAGLGTNTAASQRQLWFANTYGTPADIAELSMIFVGDKP